MQAEGRPEFVCQPCQSIGRRSDVEFGFIMENSNNLRALRTKDDLKTKDKRLAFQSMPAI